MLLEGVPASCGLGRSRRRPREELSLLSAKNITERLNKRKRLDAISPLTFISSIIFFFLRQQVPKIRAFDSWSRKVCFSSAANSDTLFFRMVVRHCSFNHLAMIGGMQSLVVTTSEQHLSEAHHYEFFRRDLCTRINQSPSVRHPSIHFDDHFE